MMPSAVIPAAPVDVMPQVFASAFTEELRYQVNLNEYPDGNSDRATLSANPRRYFRLTRPLTDANWLAMESFYRTHVGTPFWFYNPRETVPPWTWDGSGLATAGRYIVVFDGSWTETIGVARSNVQLSLREVA